MDEGVLLFTKEEVLLFIPKPRAELFVLSCQKPVNLHRTLFVRRAVSHLTAQIIRKAQGLCSVDIFLIKLTKSFQEYSGYYSKAHIMKITVHLNS